MGLFSLKIGWDVARAFLSENALTVSPPDLINSSNECNQDISGSFHQFGNFLSLPA
jgi:hypothetical protein